MRRSDTASRTVGNKKETANYSVDTSGFGYSIITDDIKADFNFLTNEIPAKLDEMLTEFDSASNSGAFEIIGSSSVKDLSDAKTELDTDVTNLKRSLSTLHQAFMTDIDNINKELEYNFGWIKIGNVKGSVRTTTIENDS